MHECNFNNNAIITWVSDPFHESLVGMFDDKLSIYDCYDEHTSVKGWPIIRNKQQINKQEKRLLQKADITFVVSDALYRSKSRYAKKLEVLSNAVDIKHFRPLDNNEIEDFKEITQISRPIIGYLGTLSANLDISMLIELAERNPLWSFVSIGPKLTKKDKSLDVNMFITNENVHILGFRPYEILPYYINSFDVCFLPLATDYPFNINCSPLKLYEYLASGKPIVSTDIPYVRKFRDLVRIGKNAKEIEKHIDDCLNERDGLKEERIAIAKKNTWERRVADMLEIIKSSIEENKGS